MSTFIDGHLSEEMEAKVWEKRMPDLTPAEQLAVEIVPIAGSPFMRSGGICFQIATASSTVGIFS